MLKGITNIRPKITTGVIVAGGNSIKSESYPKYSVHYSVIENPLGNVKNIVVTFPNILTPLSNISNIPKYLPLTTNIVQTCYYITPTVPSPNAIGMIKTKDYRSGIFRTHIQEYNGGTIKFYYNSSDKLISIHTQINNFVGDFSCNTMVNISDGYYLGLIVNDKNNKHLWFFSPIIISGRLP